MLCNDETLSHSCSWQLGQGLPQQTKILLQLPEWSAVPCAAWHCLKLHINTGRLRVRRKSLKSFPLHGTTALHLMPDQT